MTGYQGQDKNSADETIQQQWCMEYFSVMKHSTTAGQTAGILSSYLRI